MATASRVSSKRRNGGAVSSAATGDAKTMRAAAAASARRAHGKRKGRSMTSLLFGRNSERRGAHRCANDVVVDASGTNL